MTAPLVTVLMPVYNAARFLAEAITSVLNQSFRDLELLIMDDGSTDESARIAHEFTTRDPRARLLAGRHRGLVPTLNRGLEQARGRWVARMDADDISLPERIETQLTFVERNRGVAVVGTYATYIGETGRALGLYRLGPTSVAEFARMVETGELIHLIHPTILMDRAIVMRVGGYDARFRHVEDLELYNRLAEQGQVSLAIPEPKLLYRVHRGSVAFRSHFEMFRMLRFARAFLLARRNGLEPIGYGEFVRRELQAPLLRRLCLRRGDLAGYLYRKAAVEFGAAHGLRGAALAALACWLAPRYVWRKALSQVLRTRLRRP